MINVGEYGTVLYFGVGEDISSGTLNFIFCPPDNSDELTRVATVGAVKYTSDDGIIFEANEYATYTWQAADLHVDGIWQVRLTQLNGGALRKTDWTPIRVLP